MQLLLLACDPGMAAAARMQQSLAVFFKAYAAQSAQAHRHLSAAALPAARMALSIGTSFAKSAAPQLLKLVSTLLQASALLCDARCTAASFLQYSAWLDLAFARS